MNERNLEKLVAARHYIMIGTALTIQIQHEPVIAKCKFTANYSITLYILNICSPKKATKY
jgi:hypothetical protein